MNSLDLTACNAASNHSLRSTSSPSQQTSIASVREDSGLKNDSLTLTEEPQGLQLSSDLSVLNPAGCTSRHFSAPSAVTSPCPAVLDFEAEEGTHSHASSSVTSQGYQGENSAATSSGTVLQHQTLSPSAPMLAVAKTGAPVTLKLSLPHSSGSSPYRLPIYSSVRFRARNMKKQQQQQISPVKTFQQVSSTTGTDVLCNEWINDEEMLFARIVGLRLKKMNSMRRKSVRC